MNPIIKNMSKLFAIISLIRVRQWIKNFFIIVPFVLSFKFLDFSIKNYLNLFISVGTFCLITSAVYILNDINDVEEDKNHQKKKTRPLANGELNITLALLLFILFFVLAIFITSIYFRKAALFTMILYFINGAIYTFLIKHHAIFDVISISLGFVLRVLFGIFCFGAPISKWIVLLTFTLCLFLALTKRKKDFTTIGYYRKSLDGYTQNILDKFITISSTLAISCYIMYTNEMLDISGNYGFTLSNIFVIFGIFRYIQSMHLEKVDVGESGVIIYKDAIFLLNLILWAIFLMLCLTDKITILKI